MRKLLIVAASVFLLTTGAAFAQDEDDQGVVLLDNAPTSPYYAGASLGFFSIAGVTDGSFAALFGIEDVLTPGLDIRIDGHFLFVNGFVLGANALYNFAPSADSDFGIYVGGGPRFIFGTPTAFGLGAIGGVAYGFTDTISGFAELRTDTVFPVTATNVGLGIGFVYDF